RFGGVLGRDPRTRSGTDGAGRDACRDAGRPRATRRPRVGRASVPRPGRPHRRRDPAGDAAVVCAVRADDAAAIGRLEACAATGASALALIPAGFVVSYVRRSRRNVALKLVLAAGLFLAFGGFLRSVQGATTVDDARVPLAALFLWVQVLHSFDVPRRRDLTFSVVSSLILMAEAGSLSLGTGFILYLAPWTAIAAAWLYLSQRPAGHEVPEPAFVRTVK